MKYRYWYLLFGIYSGFVDSAGFDCAKAKSDIEILICENKELSALDKQLSDVYKSALNRSSTPADIKGEQKDWLSSVRNKCSDEVCLKAAYQSRLTQLASIKPLSGIAGEYERVDKNASISVKAVEYEQFHITGNAVWVGDVKTGNVNIGELDGLFSLEGNKLYYRGQQDDDCNLTMSFGKNHLSVSDDNGHCGGYHVSFDGEYRKK